MPFRPTDWTGTKNSFVEERLLSSNDPECRVIILEHRPFFSDLKVLRVGTSVPLVPGIDYELVYELPELEGVAYSKLFCGVNFINPSIGGTIRFEGKEVAGEFRGPFVEVLDKLVKYINTPPDLEWLNVDDRPSLVPQEKSANSWYDYLNKKYMASAIRDVNISSDEANNELAQKLEALKKLIVDLHNELVSFNYGAHITDPIAHEPTVAQVGAHPATRDVPRSMMAYGKTLLELTRQIRGQGLQQSDIDRYIAHYVRNDVSGTFVQEISPNRALFRSDNGASEIVFTPTEFTIRSGGAIVLSASTDLNDTIKFIEWRSGVNKLRIESSGSALGMDKILLNDRVLLNTISVLDYQGAGDGGSGIDPDDNKLYIDGRNGITFKGKGSRTDPVVGSFATTKATKTTPGAVKLKTGVGPEVDGYGATPSSLAPYLAKLQDFVPKSTRLNGIPMDDGSRTITKESLGLGGADNTADLDKPLSAAQSTLLAGLSPSDHTHSWDGLSILPATHSMAGITKYAKSIDGAAPNKGIVPAVLNELASRLEVLGTIFNAIDTTAATDFSIIDGSTWTVSSTKRSLTVKDLRYFYLVDNNRKEGHVSGTIDLETTPMFKWFSPNNRMEQTWPKAVPKTPVGISWDDIHADERPSLPFTGEPIGLADHDMGSLSIVSLLTKFSIVPVGDRLSFYIVGGGKISVYIDGLETLTSDKVLGGVVSAKSGVPVTIGIRVDCNDPAISAATMFEIYDGAVPVVFSSPQMRMVKLQEFVFSPFGIHHYLYLNMETNALFSRAEPIDTTGIDVKYALIGTVDVPLGGLSGTVSFEKQMDYGPSVEVIEHIDNPRAHETKPNQYKIVDSVVRPLGKINFLPHYKSVGTLAFEPTTEGLFVSSRLANKETEIFVTCEGQMPSFWFTPSNPKANGAPTFEGGLIVEYFSDEDLFSPSPAMPSQIDGYKLVFGGKSVGSNDGTQGSIVLGLDKTTTVNFRRHRGLGTRAIHGALEDLGVIDTKILPVVIGEGTTTDLSLLDLAPKASPVNRMLVRYRYNVSTNSVRVYTARYLAGSSEIKWLELEYKFSFDAFLFMGGYTSVIIPKDTIKGTLSVLPTAMSFSHASFDIGNYSYYRSLFEAYVDSGTLTPNGEIRLASGFGEMNHVLFTEAIYTPLMGGAIYDGTNRLLPLWFRTHELKYPMVTDLAKPTTNWRNPISMADGATSSLGGTFGPVAALYSTRGDYIAEQIKIKYTSFTDGELRVVAKKPVALPHLTLRKQASLGAPIVDEGTLPLSRAEGMGVVDILLTFNTEQIGQVWKPAQCNYVIEVYDVGGTLQETFSDATPAMVCGIGKRGCLWRSNPYHLTTRVWKDIKAEMTKERKADLNSFGEW